MMAALFSLVAGEIFIITTHGAIGDYKIGIMSQYSVWGIKSLDFLIMWNVSNITWCDKSINMLSRNYKV